MKANPQIVADFEEYPELRTLANAALRRVAELMEIHDIVEIRRIRKSGVFDRPYAKDVVTPLGLPSVPASVAASRYAVGAALLDYLETIGIRGLSLELTNEDAAAVNSLWAPRTKTPVEPEPVSTEAADATPGVADTGAVRSPAAEDQPESEKTKQPTANQDAPKEKDDGKTEG